MSSNAYDELLDSIVRRDGDLDSDESIDLSSEEDARQTVVEKEKKKEESNLLSVPSTLEEAKVNVA